MTIYETVIMRINSNKKVRMLYKEDLFNKSRLMKYVYINENTKLKHIRELENNGWLHINKYESSLDFSSYIDERKLGELEIKFPSANFISFIDN